LERGYQLHSSAAPAVTSVVEARTNTITATTPGHSRIGFRAAGWLAGEMFIPLMRSQRQLVAFF